MSRTYQRKKEHWLRKVKVEGVEYEETGPFSQTYKNIQRGLMLSSCFADGPTSTSLHRLDFPWNSG